MRMQRETSQNILVQADFIQRGLEVSSLVATFSSVKNIYFFSIQPKFAENKMSINDANCKTEELIH